MYVQILILLRYIDGFVADLTGSQNAWRSGRLQGPIKKYIQETTDDESVSLFQTDGIGRDVENINGRFCVDGRIVHGEMAFDKTQIISERLAVAIRHGAVLVDCRQAVEIRVFFLQCKPFFGQKICCRNPYRDSPESRQLRQRCNPLCEIGLAAVCDDLAPTEVLLEISFNIVIGCVSGNRRKNKKRINEEQQGKYPRRTMQTEG